LDHRDSPIPSGPSISQQHLTRFEALSVQDAFATDRAPLEFIIAHQLLFNDTDRKLDKMMHGHNLSSRTRVL
jgi:hypothetical protein